MESYEHSYPESLRLIKEYFHEQYMSDRISDLVRKLLRI